MEVSQNVKGDEQSTDRPGDLESSVGELHREMIVDIKEEDTKDSMSVQPSSSSGCVDEYLADPVEVDCVNSAYSVNLNLKQSNNVLESSANGLPCSKKLESVDKYYSGREADAVQLLSGQSEKGLETFGIEPLKIKEDQHGVQGISDGCRQIDSDMFDLSSQEKESKNLNPQVMLDFCCPKSRWEIAPYILVSQSFLLFYRKE